MKLYEINNAILALINEDGEVADYDAFEALQMEREEKIENISCWYKDLLGDAAKLANEERTIKERRQSLENRAEKLKSHLAKFVDGEKLTMSRATLTWRKSNALECSDESKLIEFLKKNKQDNFLTYSAPSLNKKAITEAIKAGADVPLCKLVERSNLQIK